MSACLAILGVLGLGLLPGEHVHSRTEQGHHTELVHRHFEPHHPIDAGVRVEDEDDHDGEAQFLTSAFTTSKAPDSVRRVDAALFGLLPPVGGEEPAQCTPPSPDASGHDPPVAFSPGLRAPPHPLV